MKSKKELKTDKGLFALAKSIRETIRTYLTDNGYDTSLCDSLTKSLPELYTTLDNVDTMMSNAQAAVALFEDIKTLK